MVQLSTLSLPTRVEVELGCDKNYSGEASANFSGGSWRTRDVIINLNNRGMKSIKRCDFAFDMDFLPYTVLSFTC